MINVQNTPIEPEAELLSFRQGKPSTGAIVSFLGLMRDINEGDTVSALELEHYPGMTEKALGSIVQEAEQRWQLDDALVIHRVGRMHPEDPIVLVAIASRHRGDGFRACEFIIDYLKTRAPFWKKESTDTGDRWVEARQSDEQAEQRWKGE